MGRPNDVAKGVQDGVPLLRLAADRVGLRKAFRVLSFMVAWDLAREALKHEPTVEEYAEHWRENRATAFRDQGLFRDAFPGEYTPTRLVELAGRQQQRDVRSLGAAVIAT